MWRLWLAHTEHCPCQAGPQSGYMTRDCPCQAGSQPGYMTRDCPCQTGPQSGYMTRDCPCQTWPQSGYMTRDCPCQTGPQSGYMTRDCPCQAGPQSGYKLQALVYDILPSTTALFSYTIGSGKLSANEHFFAGAQTVVRLLQTTQIKQGVSFITANKVYTSTYKTTIVSIETELFFFFFFSFYPRWMRLMFTCVLWR